MRAATHEERPLLCPALTRRQGSFDHPKSQAIRIGFPATTLADLYDPVAMPPSLRKAHAELDCAVDRCYRQEPFPSARARVEYLFQLYEQFTAPAAAENLQSAS